MQPKLNPDKIEPKLREIVNDVKSLEDIGKTSEEEYIKDKILCAAAENFLRRALEAVFDIGNHILSRFPLRAEERPSTYKGIARGLANKKIIDEKYAKQLEKMAGYRHRIIHFYYELSPTEIYQIIQNNLDDFKTFTVHMRKVLDNPEKYDLTK